MLKKYWGRLVLFFIRPGLDALEEERRPFREQMLRAVKGL